MQVPPEPMKPKKCVSAPVASRYVRSVRVRACGALRVRPSFQRAEAAGIGVISSKVQIKREFVFGETLSCENASKVVCMPCVAIVKMAN